MRQLLRIPLWLWKRQVCFSAGQTTFSTCLPGANTDTVLQKVQEGVAPELAANTDAIFLNSKLFKRIETIHNDSANSKLDAEDKRLVAFYYQQFVKAGARLSDTDKVTLKKLNGQDASLEAKYTNQIIGSGQSG